MIQSAQSAEEFVRQLSALAERLAAQDFVVARLDCEWASFGSWSLEVQRGQAADKYHAALLKEDWNARGPDVVRFTWDGRERLLTIETAPTPPLSSAGPFKRVAHNSCENLAEAVRVAEEYVTSGLW
jgi:hypothetical protein